MVSFCFQDSAFLQFDLLFFSNFRRKVHVKSVNVFVPIVCRL